MSSVGDVCLGELVWFVVDEYHILIPQLLRVAYGL